ncbi:7-cyano-7-deazaguanine synthase [Candidatus Pacearchaeota archaeon]|nr:7-cyano-7-deazaguanine synthase [Candidatus Pacearchaeota archaeon]
MKSAIVLCSGGIDSITTAYYVKKHLKYKDIVILFFNYGQKSLFDERKASKSCSNNLGAKFKEISLPELKLLSASLINIGGKGKKLGRSDLKDTKKESKKWYVPCRNLIFLSYALGKAESLLLKEKKKSDIFIGFKCEGNDSFPDATKEFINRLNELSNISTEGKFKIFAPLINKDKEDIIIIGKKLGVNFKNTYSCYVERKIHCGQCLACMLRKEGFYWSGFKDPTVYETEI